MPTYHRGVQSRFSSFYNVSDAPQHWNGKFFERTSLHKLGLTVFLGHRGAECPNPGRRVHKLVVGHVNGFHEVDIVFCACVSPQDGVVPDWSQLMRYGWYPASRQRIATAFTFRMLELFHELTLQAKTSLYDFHKTLSRVTDHSGVSTVPVRAWNTLRRTLLTVSQNLYKQLMVAVRQWRNLKLFKRSGRGHENEGIKKTTEGSCVVECAACPHPGRNLPDNWASAAPHVACVFIVF